MSHALSHFIELKKRLVLCMSILGCFFALYFIYCQRLFDSLATPLLKYLPNSYQIIATGVTTPLVVLLKLSFLCAIFSAIPFFIYHLCAFVSPGLYRREKRVLFPLVGLSSLLFYLGGVFAFFIVCPLALNFFYQFAPSSVVVMTDLSAYFSFVSNMILIFAFSFQIPMVIYACLYFNMFDVNQVANSRRYVIVGCFIVGMLLTPPDVISQILLAIPLALLFEFGIILYKIFPNLKAKSSLS